MEDRFIDITDKINWMFELKTKFPAFFDFLFDTLVKEVELSGCI